MLSALKRFINKNGDPATIVRKLFRIRHIPRHEQVSSVHGINLWVKKFKETGLSLNLKHVGAVESI